MGLIKTAMIAGAGIYAVNKVTKASAANKQSSQSQYPYQPQPQYTDNYNPYNGQQQQQQQSQKAVPMEFVDRRGSPSQQGQQPQQYLLTNDSSAHVPVYGYNAEGGYYFEIDPRNANATAPPAMAYASGATRGSPPPPHYNAQRQQGGFVEADELSVSDYGRKGKDLLSKFMK